MKLDEIINSMSGHELTEDEINRLSDFAKNKFDLSDEAGDELKMLLFTTSKKFQDLIFKITYQGERGKK